MLKNSNKSGPHLSEWDEIAIKKDPNFMEYFKERYQSSETLKQRRYLRPLAVPQRSATVSLFTPTTPNKTEKIKLINKHIGSIAVKRYKTLTSRPDPDYQEALSLYPYYKWDYRDNCPEINKVKTKLRNQSKKAFDDIFKNIPLCIKTQSDLDTLKTSFETIDGVIETLTTLITTLNQQIADETKQTESITPINLIYLDKDLDTEKMGSIIGCVNEVIGEISEKKYRQQNENPNESHCKTLRKYEHYPTEGQTGCILKESKRDIASLGPISSGVFKEINSSLPVRLSSIQDFDEIYQLIPENSDFDDYSTNTAQQAFHKKITTLCLISFEKHLSKHTKDSDNYHQLKTISDFLLLKSLFFQPKNNKVSLLRLLTEFYNPKTKERYKNAITNIEALEERISTSSRSNEKTAEDNNEITTLFEMSNQAKRLLAEIENDTHSIDDILYGPCPFKGVFTQFKENLLPLYDELENKYGIAQEAIDRAEQPNNLADQTTSIQRTHDDLHVLISTFNDFLDLLNTPKEKNARFATLIDQILQNEKKDPFNLSLAKQQWGDDFNSLSLLLADASVTQEVISNHCQRTLPKFFSKKTLWFSTENKNNQYKEQYNPIKISLRKTFIPTVILPAFFGDNNQTGIRHRYSSTISQLKKLFNNAKNGQLSRTELTNFLKAQSDPCILSRFEIQTLTNQLEAINNTACKIKNEQNKLKKSSQAYRLAATKKLSEKLSLPKKSYSIDGAFHTIKTRLTDYKTSHQIKDSSSDGYLTSASHCRALNIESEFTCFDFIQRLNDLVTDPLVSSMEIDAHDKILIPFIKMATNQSSHFSTPDNFLTKFKEAFNIQINQQDNSSVLEGISIHSLQRAFKNGTFSHAIKHYFSLDEHGLQRDPIDQDQHKLDIMAFALSGYQTRAHKANQWSNETPAGRLKNRLYNKTCQHKGHYTKTSLTTALVSPTIINTSSRLSFFLSSNIVPVKEKATIAREAIKQLEATYDPNITCHLPSRPLND